MSVTTGAHCAAPMDAADVSDASATPVEASTAAPAQSKRLLGNQACGDKRDRGKSSYDVAKHEGFLLLILEIGKFRFAPTSGTAPSVLRGPADCLTRINCRDDLIFGRGH